MRLRIPARDQQLTSMVNSRQACARQLKKHVKEESRKKRSQAGEDRTESMVRTLRVLYDKLVLRAGWLDEG